MSGALNGHAVVSFDGSSFFSLSDPGGRFDTQNWTLVLVAAPDPSSSDGANLLSFANGSDGLVLARSGSDPDLLFSLLSGSSPLVAPGAWGGAWERIAAQVDVTEDGSLTVGTGSPIKGLLGAPPALDYAAAYLGTDPTQMLDYEGQVAEVLVFDTTDVPSMASLQGYLAARYALP